MKNQFYNLNHEAKSLLILFSFFFLQVMNMSAQQGVGINTTTPHISSVLDITSSDKGILIPRLTLGQRNNIPSPTSGLMIYQTDNTPGFYYFNNLGNWVRVSDKNSEFSLPFTGTTGFGQEAFKVTHQNGPTLGVAIKGIASNTSYGVGVEGRSNDLNGYGMKAINNGNGSGLYAESNTLYAGLGAIQAYHTSGGNAIYASTSGANENFGAIQAENFGGGLAIKARRSANDNNTGSAIRADNNAPGGFGVRGISDASNTAGIRGESVNGVGVSGYSAASQAISGVSVSGTALKGSSTTGYALDATGKIRFTTANAPSAGAVLTSTDANGNAVWKEDNVAFKAFGMNSTYNSIPTAVFTKIHFGGEKFDIGNDYQLLPVNGTPTANSSTFTAPVNGVYHFDISLELGTYPENLPYASIHLYLNRNGTISELASNLGVIRSVGLEEYKLLRISTDENLQANDIIYVVVWHNSNGAGSVSYGLATWFNGHLVKAL